MSFTNLQQLSALLLVAAAIYLVEGTPVSQFSATSYTSDSNGSQSVVVAGDNSGTHVGIGSGPPASSSDSNFVMSRFASPPNTPRPNQVFFIPAGQDQTISTGNTVIQTRSGSGTGTGSSSQIAQVPSNSGGYSSYSVAGPGSGAIAGAGAGSSGAIAGAGAGPSGAIAVAGAGGSITSHSSDYHYDDGFDN